MVPLSEDFTQHLLNTWAWWDWGAGCQLLVQVWCHTRVDLDDVETHGGVRRQVECDGPLQCTEHINTSHPEQAREIQDT